MRTVNFPRAGVPPTRVTPYGRAHSERPAAAPPTAGGAGDGTGTHERVPNTRRTTDLPRYPDSYARIERGAPTTGPPRWILIVVIVLGALLLLGFLALDLSGGLGPGLHRGG